MDFVCFSEFFLLAYALKFVGKCFKPRFPLYGGPSDFDKHLDAYFQIFFEMETGVQVYSAGPP